MVVVIDRKEWPKKPKYPHYQIICPYCDSGAISDHNGVKHTMDRRPGAKPIRTFECPVCHHEVSTARDPYAIEEISEKEYAKILEKYIKENAHKGLDNLDVHPPGAIELHVDNDMLRANYSPLLNDTEFNSMEGNRDEKEKES